MSSLISKKTVKPGATAEDAARNMLNAYLKESIYRRVEYGGMIYRKGSLYHATGPREGTGASVDVGHRETNKGCPPGTTPAAYWHTHPNYDAAGMTAEYWEFSDADKQVAKDADVDAYVGTLAGDFMRYDRKLDKVLPLKGKLDNSDKPG